MDTVVLIAKSGDKRSDWCSVRRTQATQRVEAGASYVTGCNRCWVVAQVMSVPGWEELFWLTHWVRSVLNSDTNCVTQVKYKAPIKDGIPAILYTKETRFGLQPALRPQSI
jgi:hypothetical protein